MDNILTSKEKLLDKIFDNVYEGIVVINREAKVVLVNQPFLDYVHKTREDVIGKHVTEVVDNTRLHIALATGKDEIGDIQIINGEKKIVMRRVIYNDGKIIGVIGRIMFKNVQDLKTLSDKVLEMQSELDYYKKALREVRDAKYNFDNIIGMSSEIIRTKYMAEKAALTNSNVLIYGESGTGKELFAHAIHTASNRQTGPFVKVNCGAIPSELLESELFGYEEGAFTGAKRGGKIGKFEYANGGSIFLDEIGEMPLHMQVKLLRVLQEKVIERIGGLKSIELDVRIIAATNKDLEKQIKLGKFREDLYYRLNVMNITIPPLRDRIEDIDVLVTYLLDRLSAQCGRHIVKVSKEAMKYLKEYYWPGNVRELENVIERAINLIETGNEIKLEDLPIQIQNNSHTYIVNRYTKLKDILEDIEKKTIMDILVKTKGNKSKAAKMLDVSRTSLYEKIWKYDIE
ncbi:MAG: sigma 54-interacting transcriptional regulator [Peptostreptococcales bacterium]